MRGAKLAGPATLFASGALLFTALFFGDGISNGRLFWIGSFAVLALAALFVAGPAPVPHGWPLACAALLLGLAAWVGLTTSWSIAPDLSWAAFDRVVVYAVFLGLGLLAAALPRPARTAAAGLAALLALVLLWALLGKVIPALFPGGERVARLRNPVGYWNSLALAAAVAVALGLWVASGRTHQRATRAAGAVLVYLAELVVVLTYSRAGIAVAALTALAWLGLTRDRLESFAALVLATPVAALVALWAFSRPALTDDLQRYADRVSDGAWFGVIGAAGMALVAGAAYAAAGRSVGEADRARHTRVLGVLVATAAVAGLAAVLAVSGGKILDEFRGASTAEVTQSPGRLAELSSSNRWRWWQEAWTLFEDSPAGGKGAATFELARRPIREGAIVTTDPHNLPLRFLSETGIVGFLLLLGFATAAGVAATARIGRLEPAERAAGAALAVGVGAYAVHSLVDIHWDFVAVSAPAFFSLGVVTGLGAEQRAIRPVPALGVAAVALAVLYSLTAPYSSNRLVDSSYGAIAHGKTAQAVADADSARWLDPLSVEPLFAKGDAETARFHDAAALIAYRDAVDLQPENSSTWYALGSYEFFTGRYRAALHDLDRAYGLDPYGPAGRPGGLLDQARAKVEGR